MTVGIAPFQRHPLPRAAKRRRATKAGGLPLPPASDPQWQRFLADHPLKFVHLFAAPEKDNLGEKVVREARSRGLHVEHESIDLLRDSGNLEEGEPFGRLLAEAEQGAMHGVHGGWPCSSFFSAVRLRRKPGLP